jgi:8-oxo-dGTP pyrophosphatase MutT (NUDIX family)
MILNEYDEVVCSQRLLEGTLHHLAWQFPGGYQEYGESWEQTAQREVLEECDALI